MHAPLAPPPLHAASRPAPRPASHNYALLSTWQYTSEFNQPLSFDTSSVMDMYRMFFVRSPRVPAFSHDFPLCTPLPLRRHCPTPSRLPACTSPHITHALFSTRQEANSLSDTNKLAIRCAWAGNSAFASAGYDSSWVSGSCS